MNIYYCTVTKEEIVFETFKVNYLLLLMSECLNTHEIVFRVVTLVHVDFKPGLYKWRKGSKCMNTMVASTLVEQLNLNVHYSLKPNCC